MDILNKYLDFERNFDSVCKMKFDNYEKIYLHTV